jgi:GntR family transcriptional regulator
MTRSAAAPAEAEGSFARWQELTGTFAFTSSSLPLHARISQLMVDLIERGDLAVGERLPAERELAELLGVSLAPVRQAILDLVNKGLLMRGRGRGTFVRGPGLDEKISILHSFTESMRAQHVEVDTRVLGQGRVPVPPEVASALGLRESAAMLLERVAIVGKEPVALLYAYLSLRAYPGLVEAPLANRSLYETLRNQYGTVVANADSVIELVRSTSAEADKLGIAVGEPLLRVEGTAFSDSGKPVEYFRVLYRSDRVRFHLESHRESDRVVRLVGSGPAVRPETGTGAVTAQGLPE